MGWKPSLDLVHRSLTGETDMVSNYYGDDLIYRYSIQGLRASRKAHASNYIHTGNSVAGMYVIRNHRFQPYPTFGFDPTVCPS